MLKEGSFIVFVYVVFLEECTYTVKWKEVTKCIKEDLKTFSDSYESGEE